MCLCIIKFFRVFHRQIFKNCKWMCLQICVEASLCWLHFTSNKLNFAQCFDLGKQFSFVAITSFAANLVLMLHFLSVANVVDGSLLEFNLDEHLIWKHSFTKSTASCLCFDRIRKMEAILIPRFQTVKVSIAHSA